MIKSNIFCFYFFSWMEVTIENTERHLEGKKRGKMRRRRILEYSQTCFQQSQLGQSLVGLW